MIRKATMEDVQGLAELMSELGYPTSYENMKQRYSKINQHPDYYTLVYEIEGQLVGMTGMIRAFRYEDDYSYVRIVSMVVKEFARGKGIGYELLKASESWAKGQGCHMVTLNSGNREERSKAHEFYKRNGFVGSATGFYKKL
ncbi:GNAT family N-acetyltransferase [Piscibacillus salipiscarius]|uniref:GNAT family N-acetyltransferase n=1 Tax=Piscibacillus salipiscarius TaxID=299480 RepID=A0ABW5Q7P2_9BACI|nr:GNAT family N-acetyltransferase [Piscibacillus salipiscarius]